MDLISIKDAVEEVTRIPSSLLAASCHMELSQTIPQKTYQINLQTDSEILAFNLCSLLSYQFYRNSQVKHEFAC